MIHTILTDMWPATRAQVWNAGKEFATHAEILSHPGGRYAMLIFPDASDKVWGSLLMHVPWDEVDAGNAVEDMSNEQLGVLSGVCGRSESLADSG